MTRKDLHIYAGIISTVAAFLSSMILFIEWGHTLSGFLLAMMWAGMVFMFIYMGMHSMYNLITLAGEERRKRAAKPRPIPRRIKDQKYGTYDVITEHYNR